MLLNFVLANNLFPPQQATFSFSHIQFFHGLCSFFQLGVIPSVLSVSPPNHVVCVLHWTVLARLLHKMKSETVLLNEFKSLCLPIPFPNDEVPMTDETCVDSHCHLDKIYACGNFRSVWDLRRYFSSGACGVDLQFVISNFVFPKLWWTKDHLLDSSLVYGTIGVHPHFVDPEKVEGQLQRVADFLDGGRFIGVGEVGLDFTEKCPCYPKCLSVENCSARNRKSKPNVSFFMGSCL